jgi:hypothetical protein
MAIKQVTCSICNSTVNKAQTLALPDGTRACRSHSEAQQAAEERQKAETERLKQQASKTPAQRRREEWDSRFGGGSFKDIDPLVPQCFCCGAKGIHQTDFAARIVMAMEKMDAVGDKTPVFVVDEFDISGNPEYSKKLREHMKSPDLTGEHIYNPLMIIDANAHPQIKASIRYEATFAVQMTGMALVCGPCLKKNNIVLPRVADSLTADQFENWTLALAIGKPERQEAAKKELAEMAS